ncbi:MAG: glutathione S-transferase family protein [Porticoccaceae bacterium]|nr:glutathione S-transferase family protein [Porticoccaceae bacterium]MDG1475108.1 glutathione S-transferase family protein [Porticoccaceae bacterium]
MYKGIYTLIGQELSMFSRKLEAQLRYQGIAYQWQFKTAASSQEIDARAGTRFIPLLNTPDGWLINDTISIGPFLNERFYYQPVIPETPNQRSACFVLEDFFNHWLPRHALHSRWCYPNNVIVAGTNFGMNLLLDKSIDSSITAAEKQQIAGVGKMLHDSFGAAACVVQGAGIDQKDAMKKDFGVLMDLLADHLAQYTFLLGGRACLADFALAGALKGHFLLDPEPRSWFSSTLPLFENYLANLWQEAAKDSIWLSDDEIPSTLDPLMDYIQQTYQKFATFSIAAAKANKKFFDLDLGDGVFTARSMKRLEKARLHVQDELRRCHANSLPLNKQGILDFYLAD